MHRIAALVLCMFLCAGWSHGRGPQTYYVSSSSGNDSNNGLSQTTAWASIAKVNASSFNSGDTVAFDASVTFTSASLVLTQANAPAYLTLTSYGVGQPTLNSGNSSCVTATFLPWVTINNLHCVGGGTTSTGDGILVLNQEKFRGWIGGPTITNNTISNYVGSPATGIGHCIELLNNGSTGLAGFEATTISGNTVSGCANGVSIFAAVTTSPLVFIDVTITNNTISNNPGQNRSDGIIVGFGILGDNATLITVSNNLVHDNGSNSHNTSSGGPTGILFSNADRGLMSFNESYNQKTLTSDGEGLDFDVGTTNSLMEYNYAHNNLTAEILLFSGCGSGNTVRFNIAEAVTDEPMSLDCFGNVSAYNNTLVVPGSNTGPVCIGGGNSIAGLTYIIANNICYNTNSGDFLTVQLTLNGTGSILDVTGNDYFTSSGNRLYQFNGTQYSGIAAAQAAGFEKVSGNPVGTESNPNLTNPGSGGTCGGYNGTCPTAYDLTAASPAGKGNGLNLNSIYSITVGTQDFYGNTVTNTTLPIGAAANK